MRRQLLASVPTGALAFPATAEASADDPVFAAIEKHRQAMQALSAAHEPSDALLHELSRAEDDALLATLTTQPTTRPASSHTAWLPASEPRSLDEAFAVGL
jgi:hypothetical protein